MAPVACLLKGTLVRTPTSYVPIETLQIGEYVVNEQEQSLRITDIEKSDIVYKERSCLSKQVYKVPKGLHGAKSDLFLTRNHEIVMGDGSLKIPEECGAIKAYSKDYCIDGKFSVYHLRLERNCHFFANGCLVTSLGSSSKPVVTSI